MTATIDGGDAMNGYTARTAPRPAGDGWRKAPSVTYGGAPYFWTRRAPDDAREWYCYDRVLREWTFSDDRQERANVAAGRPAY